MLKHFYLAIDDDIIRDRLQETFQVRAFSKNGTFDVHYYDADLEPEEIENYIQA